ncbi:hydrogenase maturation protease [Actinomadura sp. HBU206391]|nr:hydrogenase maturation protease [Actinomadura sp. HBU206391]
MAGVGDVLLSDDGFGVEVARRLAGEPLPGGVQVIDFGPHAGRLAAHLLHGCEFLILIDTVERGGDPGTLYVIEADGSHAGRHAAVDGAEKSLNAAVAMFQTLGGDIARVVVVGCEPAEVGAGVGLTAPVARAVDEAVSIVRQLLVETLETPGQTS